MKHLIISLILALTLLSTYGYASNNGDGHLVIYSYHLGEVVDVQYRTGDKYNDDALKKIQHIFRSRLEDEEHDIDIKLIELVDEIQDHFGVETVELISGYRSPALNRTLKEEGIGVAEQSLHMQGRAADIHFDEIPEDALADYARSLNVGGVGYYPKNDFVHVDTGAVKTWSGKDVKERQLIGINSGDGAEVITEKNIYTKDETVRFTAKSCSSTGFTLEHFNKGTWKSVGKFKGDTIPKALLKDFGKYRIFISPLSNSNEFYLKKM